MWTETFSVWVVIDQYTEVPFLLPNVDERLTWMRSWARWDEVSLDSLQLHHLSTGELSSSTRSSRLLHEEVVEAPSPVEAGHVAYANTVTKLNLLSLVTGRGFSIVTVAMKAPHSEALGSLIAKSLEKQSELVRKRPDGALPSALVPQGSMIITASKEGETLTESFESTTYLDEEMSGKFNRTLRVMKQGDVESEWKLAVSGFQALEAGKRAKFGRALHLHAAAKMIREMYSRYEITWTALDSLTPFVDARGKEKIRGMASHIGTINGVEDLRSVIGKLYTTRNDISHGRRADKAFPTECKRRLLMLEWILENFIREGVGVDQVAPGGCPEI